MNAIIGMMLCVGLSTLFVSSLYVWDFFVPGITKRGRDDPRVIILRSISVVVSSCISLVCCGLYTARWSNFGSPTPTSLLFTVIQTMILMMGPIYVSLSTLKKIQTDPFIWLRNAIVAPIFEEIVFRDCFFRILSHSGFSGAAAIVLAPILFALSHIHHYQSIFSAIPMVLHTCCFGWIAFWFYTNKSLLDAIVSHSICNMIGLPKGIPSRFIICLIYFTGLVLFIASIL